MNYSYVYILTNQRNGTLYTGVTSNITKRIEDHKNKAVDGFTKKYNLSTLVWYEIHQDLYEARKRERQIKEWKRIWKLELIEKMNPLWKDLSLEF